jgi:hypothetical protein
MLVVEEVDVMDLLITLSIVLILALLIAGGILMRTVVRTGNNLPLNSDWIEELSVERYRPMLRMLDSGDIEFLRSQPGFTPQMGAKLRQQRAQMFSGYLRSLESDFSRVCSAMKMVMLHSNQDRPELATALLRQQFQFATGMINVRSQLFLYRWGLCNVEVSALLKIFDGVRLELRTMVPAMSMSA